MSGLLSAFAVHLLWYFALVEVCRENLASPSYAVGKEDLKGLQTGCQDPWEHTWEAPRRRRVRKALDVELDSIE